MKEYAQDVLVIDADGHGGPTTANRYLPKKFHDRVGWVDDPTGIPRPGGKWGRMLIEGRPMPKGKGTKVGFQGPASAGPWKEYGLRRGEYDPKARLDDMDLEGIDVTVLFFGLSQAGLKDKEYAVASCRASNDAYAADYCSIDGARLKATAALPLQDVKASVRELDRAVTKLGFVGACAPTNVRGKNLAHKDFWPLFEEAERLNVPVCFHIGPGTSPGIKEAGMERL
ncbi:MAG: amidohydrolase family protein, partial [Dehalococcoidia bacterium]